MNETQEQFLAIATVGLQWMNTTTFRCGSCGHEWPTDGEHHCSTPLQVPVVFFRENRTA